MSPVIDVHSHMYSREWLELIRAKGGPDYEVKESPDSPETVFYKGVSFCVLEPNHFDWAARARNMDEAGVDLAVVTLPAPSCFWGDEATSVEAARLSNDDFATAESNYPDHVRWMASLPWEYPDAAVEELARACDNGAVGVLTLGNINGRHLTDELFAPVWRAIDDRGLPVLIHPTTPPGSTDLDLTQYAMAASIGFMIDTSAAVVRLIFSGFLDEHQNLKIIAGHAGATLPYIAGRLDRVYETTKRAKAKISRFPSDYLQHIYYDTVTYRQEALELCINVGGADNVLYGSDYPFNLGDMKGCLARVDALADDMIRDKVRGGNAQRIFNL